MIAVCRRSRCRRRCIAIFVDFICSSHGAHMGIETVAKRRDTITLMMRQLSSRKTYNTHSKIEYIYMCGCGMEKSFAYFLHFILMSLA